MAREREQNTARAVRFYQPIEGWFKQPTPDLRFYAETMSKIAQGMLVPAVHYLLDETKNKPLDRVFAENPGSKETVEIFARISNEPFFGITPEIKEAIALLQLRGILVPDEQEEEQIPEEEIEHTLRLYKRETESFPEGRICAQIDHKMWRFITPLKARAISALAKGPMTRDEYSTRLFGKPYDELTFNEKRKFNSINGDLRAGFHLVLLDFRSREKDEWGPEKGVMVEIAPGTFDE